MALSLLELSFPPQSRETALALQPHGLIKIRVPVRSFCGGEGSEPPCQIWLAGKKWLHTATYFTHSPPARDTLSACSCTLLPFCYCTPILFPSLEALSLAQLHFSPIPEPRGTPVELS